MSGAEPFMLAASLGSAALGAGSQIAGGVNAYNQAKYQVALQERNATQARLDAGAQAQAVLAKGRKLTGQGIVDAAGGGATVGGSAIDVLQDLGQQSLMNARTAANSGVAEAADDESQAVRTAQQGQAALASSFLGAGASILGGAMDAWSLGQKAGTLRTAALGRSRRLGAYGPTG